MNDATAAAETDGWVLPEDAADLMHRVCDARHRWPLDKSSSGLC